MGETIICDPNPKFKEVRASFYYEENFLNKEVKEMIKAGMKDAEQKCIGDVLDQHSEQTGFPKEDKQVKKLKDHIDAPYFLLYYREQHLGNIWFDNFKGPSFQDKTEFRVTFKPVEPYIL